MAIYWYDALATTNGDGSYANPWNGTENQPIASGDEVRIKSYNIDDMTEFTFTGSVVLSNWTVTTSSAPSLNIGDLIMYDATRTCVYITGKTSTTVTFYGHASSQFTFATSITNGTFRKIKTAYLSQIAYRNHHLQASSQVANTTYSDGWINETTRVTDKSYMTIHTSIKDNESHAYFKNRTGGGNVIDLPCSCFVPSNGMYSYGAGTYYDWSRLYVHFHDNINSNINIHQILQGNNYARIYTNSNTKNTTLEIDYLSAYYGLNNHYVYNIIWDNCDVTINNMHAQTTYWYSAGMVNNTRFTFKNVYIRGADTPMLYSVLPERMGGNFTITFDGDLVTGNLASGFTGEMDSNCTINITNNFRMFSAWGATEQSTISYLMNNTTQHYGENVSFRTLPILNNFSSTFTSPTSNRAYIHNTSTPPNRHLKSPINVNDMTIFTDPAIPVELNTTRAQGTSYLFTNRATHETYEELSCPMRYGDTSYSFIVTKDDVKYNNVSPSYKFYLQTYNASYNADFFEKVIKIPVTTPNDTTEFTVSGWLWSDVGLFNQDDLEVAVYADNGDSIYAVQPVITNVETGWTRFLIPFTPAFSQLAELRIRMKPKSGAKAFWLSDVEIL